MNEAALLPSMVYVLLTLAVIALVAWYVEWVDVTAVGVAGVAVGLLLEGGLAYASLERALQS